MAGNARIKNAVCWYFLNIFCCCFYCWATHCSLYSLLCEISYFGIFVSVVLLLYSAIASAAVIRIAFCRKCLLELLMLLSLLFLLWCCISADKNCGLKEYDVQHMRLTNSAFPADAKEICVFIYISLHFFIFLQSLIFLSYFCYPSVVIGA